VGLLFVGLESAEKRFEVAEVGEDLMEDEAEVELVVWGGAAVADFTEDHAIGAVDANGGGRGDGRGAEEAHAVGGDVEHLSFEVDGFFAEDAEGKVVFKRDSVFFSAFHIGLIGEAEGSMSGIRWRGRIGRGGTYRFCE